MSGDRRGDTLNITCKFLYRNHQVHRDFLSAPYIHSNVCDMYLWMLPSDGGVCVGRHVHFMCSIIVFVTYLEVDVFKVELHHWWHWQFFVIQMHKSAIKCWGLLCPTVLNRCKVGTGIQKCLVSTGTMRHRRVLVRSRRYIGGCKWTVHGWRPTLDYEGMIWPYRDFWVYSVLYLTVGLQNVQDYCQMGATTFRLGAAVVRGPGVA